MLEEKQKTYVKDSLTRAIREMKVAKIEGRKLQSVDDFINEMRGVWYYSLKAYRDIKNSLDRAEKGECKKSYRDSESNFAIDLKNIRQRQRISFILFFLNFGKMMNNKMNLDFSQIKV